MFGKINNNKKLKTYKLKIIFLKYLQAILHGLEWLVAVTYASFDHLIIGSDKKLTLVQEESG